MRQAFGRPPAAMAGAALPPSRAAGRRAGEPLRRRRRALRLCLELGLLSLLLSFWLIGPAWAQPGGGAAPAATRYSITIQDQRAGQLLRTSAAGSTQVDYSYRDNGRGPDIVELSTLASDGSIAGYQVSGRSTFGGEIRERFDRGDGRVHWTSLVDQGELAAGPEALYLPVEYSPDWTAQLVRALWPRPEHSAAALPSGRFSAERLLELDIPGQGRQPAARVALYALIGSNLTPDFVWLREDAGMALFAMVWPSWSLVEEGFEAQGAMLLERQLQAQSERLHRLAQQLGRPLPGLTVIRNVRWFDSRAALVRGPSDVTLRDGRISSILRAGTATGADHVVEGQGRTLLPGLFDMHGHLSPDDGLLNLAAGVTTVRDMGNVNTALAALKQHWDRGDEIGPRVVAAGFIEGKSPFSAKLGIVIDSVEAGRRAIDWYLAQGYRQLKFYNSMRPEWVQPLAAYAHQRGLRVGGHVPAFMRAEQAVRAGYDELSHVNQVALNFLVKPQDDTRTLLRFQLPGDEARHIDLDGPRVQAFLALLRRRGTVVDPTLTTFEAMFLQRNGQPNPSFAMVAEHLPVSLRRSLLSTSMDIDDDKAPRYQASYRRMVELVGRLHRAGIPLLAGTDNFTGFSLLRELELYVSAGIPASQALRIATYNGAKYSGLLERTGTIEAGKWADLLLVDGDPAARISDLRKASLVIKGGVAYAPAALYQAMGIEAFAAAATISPTEH